MVYSYLILLIKKKTKLTVKKITPCIKSKYLVEEYLIKKSKLFQFISFHPVRIINITYVINHIYGFSLGIIKDFYKNY